MNPHSLLTDPPPAQTSTASECPLWLQKDPQVKDMNFAWSDFCNLCMVDQTGVQDLQHSSHGTCTNHLESIYSVLIRGYDLTDVIEWKWTNTWEIQHFTVQVAAKLNWILLRCGGQDSFKTRCDSKRGKFDWKEWVMEAIWKNMQHNRSRM